MQRNQKEVSSRGIMLLVLVIVTALTLREGLTHNAAWYNIAFITLPMLCLLLIPSRKKV